MWHTVPLLLYAFLFIYTTGKVKNKDGDDYGTGTNE